MRNPESGRRWGGNPAHQRSVHLTPLKGTEPREGVFDLCCETPVACLRAGRGSPLVNGFVDGSHEVVHGRLARGFPRLAAPYGRDRHRWPPMSRFAETQPVRGRQTAYAVIDSLAVRRGLSFGERRSVMCSSVSPTDSTPRAPSTATMACHRGPRSSVAMLSGFGWWHLRGAVWREPSGSHRDLGPLILAGATFSEVTFRDRSGPATRAPVIAGLPVVSDPGDRQPSVTSRRCGSERVGRRGGRTRRSTD